MEAAPERDFPARDSNGVPRGRGCTCGVDMMKAKVEPKRNVQIVRWACSCCGRDEQIAYATDGSARWVDA